jgi:hypothetical protein
VLVVSLFGCTPATTADSAHSGDSPPAAEPLTLQVIGFNTESGGSDPGTVADEVIADMRGEGLWGFAEVEDSAAAERYVAAAADPGGDESWDHVLGTTGYSDRLVLAWDDARFSLESSEELVEINVGGTVRAPLVGRMRERSTDLEFLFVVNHLWRTDEPKRHEQAELLNAWGREQSLPVVMVGDFNLDWDVQSGRHDEGYDLLTDGGVFEWVKPDPLLSTQCSGYYDSVLDFVFVGGEARSWGAESDVLRPDDSYCSGSHRETWSDHRPVRAVFTVPRG